MDQPRIITEIAGHGAIGLAFLDEGPTRQQGLFVRHRHDDSWRLVFDLYVPGKKNNPVATWNFETHPRRQGVEFSVSAGIEWPVGVEWPEGVGVLMSRRCWEIQGQMAHPFERSDWPSFDSFRDYVSQSDPCYSSGGKHGVDVTRIVLGSPTKPSVDDGHGRWRFESYLGLIDCHQEICLVSRQWLEKRSGMVIPTRRGTCFFPSDHVLQNR